VLHIGKFFPPDLGGMETFLHDLVEHVSREVTCDVLCFNTKNRSTREDWGNYSVTRASCIGNLWSAQVSLSVIGLMAKMAGQYDIIHMHLPNPTANIAYFLARPDTRLVLQWQSDILRQKNVLRVYDPFQKWLLNKADRIIASSEQYLEGSEYLLKHRDKSVVIPLGLDPKRLKSDDGKVREIRSRYGRGRKIIFTVGRLVYYKGIEYLIEAMRDVDATLIIGGGGQLKIGMEKRVAENGLNDKIFFTGRIPDKDIGNYFDACDGFCLPSIEKTEAFGMVQLEAMCFSKPVISTDINGSGVSWVNQDGRTGIIVKPKDTQAMRNGINALIGDPEMSKTMGDNGRRRLIETFHISGVGNSILDVYNELIDRG